MSGVQQITVARDDDGIRLDRWFQRHFPQLTHGRLQKLLRKKDIRVDGQRAEASQRLTPGQVVRVPPLPEAPAPAAAPKVDAGMAEDLRRRILHDDGTVLVIDKPPGLAVQGGSGQRTHLDALLASLAGSGEPPRLAHRLDRDTSGVLVLGRTANAAAALTAAFRARETRKLYWALVVGVPETQPDGEIRAALAKRPGAGGEKVVVDHEAGKSARTLYHVMEKAGTRASWLALWPLSGRTHQLRVHLAAINRPVLGDGKYGGPRAFLSGSEVARKLHLHARRIILPHPDGGTLDVTAPLPSHMKASWDYFGFDADRGGDPFPARPEFPLADLKGLR